MTASGPGMDGAEEDQFLPVEDDDRQFGRYQLRYEIASGGMATVYLARSKGPAGFDRAMALKRIHPHLAKKRDFVEMFLDEARLSARITHPNVCSVFDFGEVDGTYFMAMEYLVGQPLNQLLRGLHKRPDLATSRRWYALGAKIIADACEGLHAAHELTDERGQKLGVVHRDCTPHNVFVTYDGGVKVIDFGVAFAAGRLHHTQTGSLKGKLAYMSPEQVRGQAIDRRTDVWALGVCLWELLTIRRLFSKKQEVEMIQAVMSQPISRPTTLAPSIPPELERIALKALSRDIDERYPTTRAMARDLNAYVSSSGVSAGLADLSELMEEVFARERETKLGVVASVLQTPSDVIPTSSGQRIVSQLTPAPAPVLPFTSSPTPAPSPLPAPSFAPSPSYSPAPASTPSFSPAASYAPAPVSAPSFSLPPTPAPATPVPHAPPTQSFVPVPPVGLEPAPIASTRPPNVVAWIAAAAVVSVLAIAGVVVMNGRDPTPVSTPLPAVRAVVIAPPPTSAAPPISIAAPVMAAPVTTTARVAPRTGPGTIAISVTGGWADIYVDGERRGRTPRQLEVPAGRHDVELRPNGAEPGQHQTVNVRAGATSRVTVRLGG